MTVCAFGRAGGGGGGAGVWLSLPPGTRNNSCSGAGQCCDSACVLGLELFSAVSTSETLGGSESC